jgi:glycosyltransferase involved in cell wall biosynthesis
MNTNSHPSKKALLYDPYLDVVGGGEQHMLTILKIMEKAGYQVHIAWHDTNILSKIQETLGIRFVNPIIEKELFHAPQNPIKRAFMLSQFDTLFYIPDGSYFFSLAKHNFLYAMVPSFQLYPHTSLDKLKFHNWNIIANSQFTKQWLATWGHTSIVHYPSVSDSSLALFDPPAKEQLILSVGRFFKHLHNKKQKELIETFIKLQQSCPAYAKYRLVVAGGLKAEDQEYFDELKSLAQAHPSVTLLANAPFDSLQQLYKRAEFFWHMTGLGVDQELHPEQVEHFGITPLEAMAAGCVVCAYNAGGPREIIQNTRTGYLFDNPEQLIEQMTQLSLEKNNERRQVSQAAHDYVKREFSITSFQKHLFDDIITS